MSAQSNAWTKVSDESFSNAPFERQIIPTSYHTFELDLETIKKELKKSPKRFSEESRIEESLPILMMPDASGELQSFKFVESGVMHPNLAAKYPDIKTYIGVNVKHPSQIIYCGVSHKGFHGMIKSPDKSTTYLDIYARGMIDKYIVYSRQNLQRTESFVCEVKDDLNNQITNRLDQSESRIAGDCQFRIFDLALACTGEYAQFHGGTVADVMAEFVISMVRVNGIYETDANVTMVLIEDNDELIFLNGTTDPYTNNNGGAMLDENQNTIDDIIGFDNYHIGHVFSTGGGGIAQLRSPCGNGKSRGVTGLGNPTGDPFWVDYVSHEMGHQFGGNHTQNNNCNRAGNAAVEPGSASSIMGYAGICAPNVQNNSDDHFHAYNLAEIAAFLNGNGGTCPTLSPNGNTAPTITIESDSYVVPISTSLRLTASATDIDEDDVLTYCWEQMDSEVADMPPEPTNTGGPAFRSNSPTTTPTRYLPNIDAVIAGTTPMWEVIPSVSREMDWRCTIRDNNIGGGCTTEADVALTFTDSAGPFLVESPNTSDVIWRVGSTETVSWDVANTDAAPVNSTAVDILLSSDGGYTYPNVLATSVPNTGSYDIMVPFVLTDQARVMVLGSENIFFDISNENFNILEPLIATFNLIVDNPLQVACLGEDLNYNISLISFLDYDEEVTFSTQGAPDGLEFEFASPVSPSVSTNILTVQGTGNLDPGSYLFDIVGESIDTVMTTEVELIILETIQPTTLNTPANGATQIPSSGVSLEWEILGGEEEFLVEISTDLLFDNIVATTTTPENIYDLETLIEATVYYWRVRGINQCQDGDYSPTYAFQTSRGDLCTTYPGLGPEFPYPIPPDVSVELTISDAEVGDYIKINIDVLHEWVGDLVAVLVSPSGDEFTLFDQPGIDNSQFGCQNDDMLVSIFDGAENTSEDLANTCESESPTISGDYQPVTSLDAYNNTDVNGTWLLNVTDAFPQADDGALQDWSIEVCSTPTTNEVSVDKDLLIVPQGLTETITQDNLETSGEAELITYTLTSLPVKGTLQIDANDAAYGDTFTQSDINNGLLTYIHNGVNIADDSFTFDIVDDQSNWLPSEVQEILILANDLSATAMVTNGILCQGGAEGEITVTVEGGNAPYSYILDAVEQESPIFTDLGAGIYEITVKDKFDYEVIVSDIVIEDKEALEVDFDVDVNTISVMATGGTSPYLYSVNGGIAQSNPTFSNLGNNTYEISVTDVNGCEAIGNVTINVDGLQADAYQTTVLSCFNDNNAIVLIEALNGFPPYEYRIVGQPWQNSFSFEGLSAGNYTFRIRDSENNVINIPLTITQPDELLLDTDVTFNTLTMTGIGGTGELTYLIDGNAVTSTTITDLDNGDYTLTAIDENDCQVTQVITIAVADLTLESEQTQNIECFGNRANIMLTANGGIGPYQYSRTVGVYQDSPIFTNLIAGTYTFRVRDTQGKTAESEITITQPDLITGDLVIINNSITVVAVGGTGDLTYQIDNGTPQSDNTFSNLPNGIYAMRITDQLGCSVTIEAVVDVPALLAAISELVLPSCTDDTNGSLTLIATDGIPPYSYSIDGTNYQDSPTFSGLGAGEYQPSVRDDLGQVTQLHAITFVNPEPVSVSVMAFGPTITLVASGGTAPYTYSLNGGAFSAQTEYPDLTNGEYDIRVRDSNGCEGGLESEGSYVHNSLQGFTFSTIPISCAGEADGSIGNFTIIGGIEPYTYFVNGIEYSPQSLLNSLEANTYEVTVQDATGYSAEPQTAVLIDPEVLTLDFSTGSGTIDLISTGGTGNLQYSLDGGVTFQDSPTFTEVPNGDYTAMVMDANGCTTDVAIIVSSSDELTELVEFMINPNPSTGVITLQLSTDLSRDLKVYITNALGQNVYNTTLENNNSIQTLNLENLTNGQYQVTITNGQMIGVKKIIIQH